MKATLAAVIFCLFASTVFASAPLADRHVRYIVVVHTKPKGAANAAAAEATALGATVEADLGDRLIITGSAAAIEALRRHGGVRYVQSTVLGALTPAACRRPSERVEK